MNEFKKCSRCKKIKPINEFYKNKQKRDGLYCWCKYCERERYNLWKLNNPEKVKEKYRRIKRRNLEKDKIRFREYKKNNREKIKIKSHIYYELNKEIIKKRNKRWYENNKEHIKQYRKKYYQDIYKYNIKAKISKRMSCAIWRSLKMGKNGNHWKDLVGFTLQELMQHLENQFREGMSWDNYGKWHIDHIRPVSNFNFSSYKDSEFKECWALENLQPLWAKENLIKSNRYGEKL